jgi:hypothetical protein
VLTRRLRTANLGMGGIRPTSTTGVPAIEPPGGATGS